MSENNNIKEIDLYLLIKAAIKFLIENKVVILLMLFLGSFIAVFQFYALPGKYDDYYRSILYVQSDRLSSRELHILMNNLSYQYKDLLADEYDRKVINNIRRINPKNELSIDGKCSYNKIIFDKTEKEDINDLITLIRSYIERSNVFILRGKKKKEEHKVLLDLLNEELLSLGYEGQTEKDLKENKDSISTSKLLSYITLIKKKQAIEKKIYSMRNDLEFIVVEPQNELIKTSNLKIITFVGYSSLMVIISSVVITVLRFFKKESNN